MLCLAANKTQERFQKQWFPTISQQSNKAQDSKPPESNSNLKIDKNTAPINADKLKFTINSKLKKII